MKKLSQKQQKELIKEFNQIKIQKSELTRLEKLIKEKLMGHLAATNSDSLTIGDQVVRKKVSSYGFNTNVIGVKVTEAANDLTKKLLGNGKNNLLSIKPKTALLFQLQEQNDKEMLELMTSLGIEVIEKHSIEIK